MFYTTLLHSLLVDLPPVSFVDDCSHEYLFIFPPSPSQDVLAPQYPWQAADVAMAMPPPPHHGNDLGLELPGHNKENEDDVEAMSTDSSSSSSDSDWEAIWVHNSTKGLGVWSILIYFLYIRHFKVVTINFILSTLLKPTWPQPAEKISWHQAKTTQQCTFTHIKFRLFIVAICLLLDARRIWEFRNILPRVCILLLVALGVKFGFVWWACNSVYCEAHVEMLQTFNVTRQLCK